MGIVLLPLSSFYDDNIFNCNLNTLKKFFPIEDFPLPKDTKYINYIPWFFGIEYDMYDKMFKDKMSIVDKFKNSRLFYDFMEKDLGIYRFIDIGLSPVHYMYSTKYNNSIVQIDDSEEVNKSYIESAIDKMYEYYLLSDKNLSHAKDELKRMRMSTTAMGKRLMKDSKFKYNGIYDDKVIMLSNYYKFVLKTYQLYMEDKTTVAKRICKDHIVLLNRYYIDMGLPIPNKLERLNDMVK